LSLGDKGDIACNCSICSLNLAISACSSESDGVVVDAIADDSGRVIGNHNGSEMVWITVGDMEL